MRSNAIHLTAVLAVAMFVVAMFVGACAGPGAGDDRGGDPPTAGTLVTAGSRWVQSRDLASDSRWTGRIEYGIGYGLPAAHIQGNALYMARFTFDEPFHVDVHDLRTFELVEERAIEWPGTSLANQVLGLAVSPDAAHVAGVLSDSGGTYLEVLERGSTVDRSVLSGFRNDTGEDLVWLDDETLLFAMDFAGVTDPAVGDLAGGIVAIDLSGLMAGGPPGSVNTDVIVGFGAEAWNGVDGVNGVHSFALSPGGNRLVYTYGGDIWVTDLDDPASEPRQLTRGPFAHQGAAFSPDGSRLAFVEYVPDYTSSVHLIPSGPTEPLQIDSDSAEGSRYRLDGVLGRRILAWLP